MPYYFKELEEQTVRETNDLGDGEIIVEYHTTPRRGSIYQTKDGAQWIPESKPLGKGRQATSRKLRLAYTPYENQEELVVLQANQPGAVNKREVLRKFEFFSRMHSSKHMHLQWYSEDKDGNYQGEDYDYRMVLPLVPGKRVKETWTNTLNEFLDVFISAAWALNLCHENGFIYFDFTSENMISVPKENGRAKKFPLVDGGSTFELGEAITGYQVKTEEERLLKLKQSPGIAPECIAYDTVYADPSMDVFSLGKIMQNLYFRCDFIHYAINPLSTSLSVCREYQRTYNVPHLYALYKNKLFYADRTGVYKEIPCPIEALPRIQELFQKITRNTMNLPKAVSIETIQALGDLCHHSFFAEHREVATIIQRCLSTEPSMRPSLVALIQDLTRLKLLETQMGQNKNAFFSSAALEKSPAPVPEGNLCNRGSQEP